MNELPTLTERRFELIMGIPLGGESPPPKTARSDNVMGISHFLIICPWPETSDQPKKFLLHCILFDMADRIGLGENLTIGNTRKVMAR